MNLQESTSEATEESASDEVLGDYLRRSAALGRYLVVRDEDNLLGFFGTPTVEGIDVRFVDYWQPGVMTLRCAGSHVEVRSWWLYEDGTIGPEPALSSSGGGS